MTQTSARRISIGLSGLVLGVILLLTQVKPAQAGWLDWLFNTTVTTATDDLVSAGEKADTGILSQGPTVSNTTGFFMTDALVRLVGPSSASLQSASAAQKAAIYQKYGHGAIADITGAIPYFYQPPATTQTFLADVLDSAHIVPKAQAQGLGFAALDPILSTWKMFRNLAYLLYVVIFLVIGLMVMFKAQMGKAAVTLQSALPNIIVSLLFVTFSYAIAGFMIDVMYVLMYLLVGMFPSANGSSIMNANFMQVGWTIIVGDGQRAGAFKSFADAVDGFVSQAVNFSHTDSSSSIGGAIAGITMSLIMAVAILVGVFKLFFELLKTYVTIVLLIAFSPLLLMFGALPGKDVFRGWLTDLGGNLLAFPTTLLIIIVFRMFTSADGSVTAIGNSATQAGGFLPPFLIGRGSSGALTTLVGIGIVLIMPELIVQMKKAVGVKDGIFTMLAKDMSTNFVKEGVYAAAPTMGAAAGIPVSMAASGLKYGFPAVRNHRFDRGEMWRQMVSGNPGADGTRTGGIKGGISGGLAAAQQVKVTADRALSGQVFEPETIEKRLAALAQHSAPPKHGEQPASTAGRASTSGV